MAPNKTDGVLVVFVLLTPFDLGEFINSAFVPRAAQTPEFLRLCELLDGEMPGESGESRKETREIAAGAEALDAMCEPHMLSKGMGSRVCLPDNASVTRVVTVSYHS